MRVRCCSRRCVICCDVAIVEALGMATTERRAKRTKAKGKGKNKDQGSPWPRCARGPEARARFEREARTISTLNHPNICTLHDVGHQDGVDFLVMEYLEGETLAERLQKGALPLDQALDFATQMADALDKAHRQSIVHRDLKPANIMLTASGPKLLDFGLAKQVSSPVVSGDSEGATEQKDLTRERALLGTLQYVAPEQLEGEPADARSDLFAFGAVLHEMVTGKKAFEGKAPATGRIRERSVSRISTQRHGDAEKETAVNRIRGRMTPENSTQRRKGAKCATK